MSDALTRVLQGSGLGQRPPRMERVAVVSTSPLTVRLPDGAVVAAVAVDGLTYTAAGAAVIFRAEPGAPLALPVTGTAPVFVPNNVDTGDGGPSGVNTPPTAAFTLTVSGLTVTVNSAPSTDADGTITARTWTWGDGTASSGVTASHTYTAAGTKTVTLTVTDNDGATDTAAKPVTLGGTGGNLPPTAAFTYTQGTGSDSYRLNVDASASTDPDGAINSYHWDFGNGAVYDTTNPVANGFYYTGNGSYAVTLTVTDNDGATDTAAQTITVTDPPSTGSGGTGVQPAGAGISRYQDLTGSTFNARLAAAPTSNSVSFASSTFAFSNFAVSTYYGAVYAGKGLLGSGRDYTTIQMNPSTSTKASAVPTASGTTNPLYLIRTTNNGAVNLTGFHLHGTSQGHLYNGLRVSASNSPTLADLKVSAIPGNSAINPGETFHINLANCSNITVHDVELDGANIGASGFGANSCTGGQRYTDVTVHGMHYCKGWAGWQCTGGGTFTRVNAYNNAFGFGFERCDGTYTLTGCTFGTATRADIHLASDTSARAHLVINDPVLPAGKTQIKVLLSTNELGNPNLQTRGDVKVYVGGVDRSSTMLTFVTSA